MLFFDSLTETDSITEQTTHLMADSKSDEMFHELDESFINFDEVSKYSVCVSVIELTSLIILLSVMHLPTHIMAWCLDLYAT